jgi:hypothetical protein
LRRQIILYSHICIFIDVESSIEAEDKEVKGIDIDGVKVFNSSTVRLIAHLPSNMTWQQGNIQNLLKEVAFYIFSLCHDRVARIGCILCERADWAME